MVTWAHILGLQFGCELTELLVREKQRERECKDGSLLEFLPIRLTTGEQFVAPGSHRRGCSRDQFHKCVLRTKERATGIKTNAIEISVICFIHLLSN